MYAYFVHNLCCWNGRKSVILPITFVVFVMTYVFHKRFSNGLLLSPSSDTSFMKILDNFDLWQRRSSSKTAIFQYCFSSFEKKFPLVL